MSTRRALITGITGQDGSYLAELLAGKGYEVIGMARGGAVGDGEATILEGDLLDPASLRRVVEEAAPDEVYHLAAPTFVPASWDDPTESVAAIATGTAALLGALRATRPDARVWVATSSEIFGDASESPQSERSDTPPRSPYGVAKLAVHGLVRVMREHHGMHVSSGITYNHESPRRPAHFLPRKVTRGAAAIARGREQELVLGSLDAVRDWSHARDVVRAGWLALQHDEPGDYVVAGGVGRTVRDLVGAAFAHAGVDPERHVRVDPDLVRPLEAVPLVGDASKARSVLGWAPETTFEEMIGEMVDADLRELDERP